MKGFKDTTRVQYSKGGEVCGPKGAAKVSQVMSDFKGVTKKAEGGQVAPRALPAAAQAAIAQRVLPAKAAQAAKGQLANRVQGVLSRLPRR